MHAPTISVIAMFTAVVNGVTEMTTEQVLLHSNDLVLVSETMEVFSKKLRKWKKAENKGLKVNLEKTKGMVNGANAWNELITCEVNPNGICSLRVMCKNNLHTFIY